MNPGEMRVSSYDDPYHGRTHSATTEIAIGKVRVSVYVTGKVPPAVQRAIAACVEAAIVQSDAVIAPLVEADEKLAREKQAAGAERLRLEIERKRERDERDELLRVGRELDEAARVPEVPR